MAIDPALASRSAREPESLDKVTNPLVLLVAGEVQLPTYPCHFGRSNRCRTVTPTRANESRQLSNLFVTILACIRA
jgi:hypothetical protein